MNFYIKTLGCKVNQAESEDVTKLLTEYGHIYTKSPISADLIIINTCTVTHIADRKSRQMIRKLKNENPIAEVIVTGCSVENETSNLPEIGVVIKKTDLINYLHRYSSSCNNKLTNELSKVRKNLLVQNGCNYFCSYCIIPFVRNKLISYSSEQLLKEAQENINQGIKELVLTGINLGLYNHNGVTLTGLVKQLLQLKGDFRLRLGSIEPNLVTDELLALIENENKLCPHLHLPLQGSSDNLLSLMQRKYTLDDYLSLVNKINSLKRKTTVTSDIIIGHPSETEDDFLALLSILTQNIFLNIHLFAYSVREGTKSATLPNHVPEIIKKARMTQAQLALKANQKKYKESLKNIHYNCLIETNKENYSEGYTEHYVLIQIPKKLPINTFYIDQY
ncbi:MAG: MiaB/RimO family radical SAM methylthiotransferase [Candidatus Margulisbacteria bacterium]|nr:MiaB/RimO family radical SAM methylthiotransferase [Candidatus Margulisiibacteriota bacterium]